MSDFRQSQEHRPEKVSDDLASFISNLSIDVIPDDGYRLSERAFLDTVGVMLAGSVEDAGSFASRMLQTISGDDGRSTVFFSGEKRSVTDAVFANATAGHALDFDDVAMRIHTHPSVALIPPIIAVSEVEESTGLDAITAFIAGLETEYYLSAPINPSHYEQGWHATSTIGAFGSAAATANLLGLTETKTRHALNSAASMSSGLKKNFGSMTKPMHAGHAARAGVTAAFLANEGFTASPEAIGTEGGFFDLYGGADDPDFAAFYNLGEEWASLNYGTDTKKYPCCYFTHSAMEAAAILVDKYDLTPEDVDKVTVKASGGANDVLVHSNPNSGLEGKFSMQHAVACAITRKPVTISAFTEEGLSHEPTTSVRNLVTFERDTNLAYGSHSATVSIETVDGSVLEHVQKEPPGTIGNPLSDAEMKEKFLMTAQRRISSTAAGELFEVLDTLREEDDVATIVSYITE